MIEKYIYKRFNIKEYNCWDFIRDVYYDLHKVDIKKRTPDKLTKRDIFLSFIQQEKEFKRIEKPEQGCIVLFIGKNQHHTGIYYNKKVLHLTQNGAKIESLDVAKLSFREVRFYK